MKVRFGTNGIHLFDRVTGVNVLLDEVAISERTYSKAPRQVSIALTNACDLRCLHCYATKKAATLSYDSLTAWLSELDEYGTLGVGFGGGEPTLFPRFVEICAFTQRETNLAVTFTTHGHWLTEAMLDKLESNVNFLRVSMDGIGHTYETIRGKSFSSFIDRLTALHERIPFGINYVINDQTLPDLNAASELVESLGATELLLLPEIGMGGVIKVNESCLSQLKQWILSYKGNLRLAISEGNEIDLPICDALPNETGLSAYAHIDAMGFLKRNSYHATGMPIKHSVLDALKLLSESHADVQEQL